MSRVRLLREAALYELNEAVNSELLVAAVSDDADLSAANDTEREDTEQGLCVYSALFLLDPDGRLVLVSLLDKESCGSCVETNLVLLRLSCT